MKKLLLLSLFLVLIGEAFAQRSMVSEENSSSMQTPKNVSANSIQIGYCGEWKNSLGLGANVDISAAICLPETTMKKNEGNKLSQILVWIGPDEGTTNTSIFLTYALNKDPFYTQDVTFSVNQMNVISLTTPYQIEGKEIYVGYKLTSGTGKPLAIDEAFTPAGGVGDYVAMKGKNGKMEWSHMWETGFSTNVMIKAVVEGNSLPQYDIDFEYLMPAKNIVNKGDVTSVNGSFRNLGIQKITAFTVKYQINDAEVLTKSFENVNISSSESYNFEIDDIKVDSEGVTSIKMTISSLNGNESLVLNNNIKTVGIACLVENTVPRKVLLENFTTSQCTACPGGHKILNSLVGDNENVIWVAHHAGYYIDKFTIPASEDYIWFYNSTDVPDSPYAPGVMLDRTNLYEFGAKDEASPVSGLVQAAIEATLKSRLEAPAYVTVNISQNYDPETRKLEVTVSGNSLLGGLPGCPSLNVYLTEDNLAGIQVGADGMYTHDHVIRGLLTNTWGDPVEFDNNGNYSKTCSFELNKSWKIGNMKIIAFLSNFDARNVNNCDVYNAEQVVLNEGNSIENTTEESGIRVYSDNSQITIDGEYANAMIYNTNGSIVAVLGAQQNSLKVSGGVYLVKVVNDDDVVVRRVAVK